MSGRNRGKGPRSNGRTTIGRLALFIPMTGMLLLAGCVPRARPASDFFPAYTRDGNRIVFASIPFQDGDSEIWIMDGNGTGRRRLTRLQEESGRAMREGGFRPESARGLSFYPAIAPTGNEAAFVSVIRRPSVLVSVIYRLDLGSGILTPVIEIPAQRVGPVTWSPDGSTLLFASDKGGMYELWSVPAAGGEPRAVTANRFHTWSASWAPASHVAFAGNPRSDGSIAFDPKRVGMWEIFLLDPGTNEVRRVTENDHDDFSPAWHPGGRSLAFVSRTADEWRLNLMEPESGKIETLWRDRRYLDHPAWHPSGRKLAFTRGSSSRFEGYFMDLEIWELDLASRLIRNLSDPTARESESARDQRDLTGTGGDPR